MASAYPPVEVHVLHSILPLARFAAERNLSKADELLTELLAIAHGWSAETAGTQPAPLPLKAAPETLPAL